MPEYGSVSAAAYTARRAIPLRGVSVSITQGQDGDRILHAYRVTDEEGMIEPVPVETPPLALSRDPNSTAPGYSTVDVQFDLPAYFTITIRNVQVFPENESIQFAELPPLPENTPKDQQSIVYTITPQDL